MGLLSEIRRIQIEQDAFARVNYYEFKKSNILPEHIQLLKTKGEILVGCLEPSCIYKLSYDKTTEKMNIETWRSDMRSTAAFAGWPVDKLINYICGGIIYQDDLLVVKRRPEEEIVALEKAYKKECRINDIKFCLALLGLITLIAIPFIDFLNPR